MSNEIDLQAFLDAAFGTQDCDSGYGAVQPRSRDIKTFFEGRIGRDLPTGAVFHVPYGKDCVIVQKTYEQCFVGLFQDLLSLTSQMEEIIHNTERERKE